MGIHYDPSEPGTRLIIGTPDAPLMPCDISVNERSLGVFRGLLFALPASGILWAALFLGCRWILS
jgi:hypothetical protein